MVSHLTTPSIASIGSYAMPPRPRPRPVPRASNTEYVAVNSYDDNLRLINGAVYEGSPYEEPDTGPHFEDLPNVHPVSNHPPVRLLPGEGKDGRRRLTKASKDQYKDFKLRSQYHLLETEALARAYVAKNAARLEKVCKKAIQKGEPIPQPQLTLRSLSLQTKEYESYLLRDEARHYEREFAAIQDRPRHAAATKHHEYIDNAQKMATPRLLSDFMGEESYGNAHESLLDAHETYLNRAKQAHTRKEERYPSRSPTAW
ncbi:hypothetical protein CBS101457_005093 [Exobasidium rhododendri]|nr:hypothetical protein CBS101457_005093 [Exobasidium rhododendri]